jgi:hypothetical protein
MLSVSPAAHTLRPVPVRNDPTSFGSDTLANTHLKPKIRRFLDAPTRELAAFYSFDRIVSVPKMVEFWIKKSCRAHGAKNVPSRLARRFQSPSPTLATRSTAAKTSPHAPN